MPTLPTLTITAAQATRLLAVFQGQTDPQGQPLTPQQAYKRWLRDQLLNHVRTTEVAALKATQDTAATALTTELDAALTIDPTV